MRFLLSFKRVLMRFLLSFISFPHIFRSSLHKNVRGCALSVGRLVGWFVAYFMRLSVARAILCENSFPALLYNLPKYSQASSDTKNFCDIHTYVRTALLNCLPLTEEMLFQFQTSVLGRIQTYIFKGLSFNGFACLSS
jgi:hypothetical protein